MKYLITKTEYLSLEVHNYTINNLVFISLPKKYRLTLNIINKPGLRCVANDH